MSEVWFTSDTHFGHANILDFCNRPFSTVQEMNEALVENWNSVIGKGDRIYHLGDVAWLGKDLKQDEASKYLHALKGDKYLIKGNHDSPPILKMGWNQIYDYKEIKIEGQHIVMSHFPMLTWHRAHKGSWMLHGHCHGGVNELNADSPRLDVGSDNFDYTPINFSQIKELFQNVDYTPVDHHGA
jgi:calcineurin-like phosphoesterase family protein